MKSTRERWIDFVNLGLLNFSNPQLAIASKQPGPGGSNYRNVYQYQKTTADPTPNGSVFVPTTTNAYCLSADTTDAWKKTDGVISNTGWVLV